MDGPRPPTPEEWPQLVEFLNRELRPQMPWTILNEYPTALNVNNLHNIRILTGDEKILSHAVLKPLIVKTPHLLLKMGAIGSVVTQSEYRGQGLSRQIIDSCLQEAQHQHCDLAVLWTDIPDFYRKFGFELAGREESFVIEQKLATQDLPQTLDLHFMSGSNVAPEAILKIYQQHSVTTFRTSEDIRRFLQIPGTKVYTAWDKENRILAYAVEGKGADLTNYVHEWGGSVSALVPLLNEIFRLKGGPFTVMTPGHSQNLHRHLQTQSCTQHSGYLGMLKIVQREQFLQKVDKALLQLAPIHKMDPSRVLLEWESFSDADLLRLIFGPEKDLHPLLPLPLWMWGWDSV